MMWMLDLLASMLLEMRMWMWVLLTLVLDLVLWRLLLLLLLLLFLVLQMKILGMGIWMVMLMNSKSLGLSLLIPGSCPLLCSLAPTMGQILIILHAQPPPLMMTHVQAPLRNQSRVPHDLVSTRLCSWMSGVCNLM